MGKSKYQVKAHSKVKMGSQSLHQKPKYYDENIKKKGGMSKSFFIFIIVMIFVGFGTGIGFIIANSGRNIDDNNNNNNGGSTPVDDTDNPITIQINDDVVLEYTLWIAPAGSGTSGVIDTSTPHAGPDQFPATVKKGNLINGFYYAIIGMEVGETKEFTLDANIDYNGDGIDDNTGQEILSYGSPGHDLFNTNLKFRVKVISIN